MHLFSPATHFHVSNWGIINLLGGPITGGIGQIAGYLVLHVLICSVLVFRNVLPGIDQNGSLPKGIQAMAKLGEHGNDSLSHPAVFL